MTVLREIKHGIKCDVCGKTTWMPTTDTIRPGPIKTWRDRLRRAGWRLGLQKDRRDVDICSDCATIGITVDDIS